MELIRIQSSEGQARINAPSNETISWLKEQVSKEFKTESSNIELSLERNGSNLLDNKATLSSQNIKRGSLLYCIFKVTPKREIVIDEKTNSIEKPKRNYENHYVDEILSKDKAMIKREMDERYCGRHGKNGACIECMPLPPWRFRELDKFKKVAHLPFHSWLRMKTESAGTNKYFIEEETYVIPKTQVAKPKTVLPTGQEYRHVDFVCFQSRDIGNVFIDTWRKTGNQRIGFLFGKYVPDTYIPLGVKAVVEAIYEPPQRNSRKGSKLLEDKNKDKVDEFAKLFGLERIGLIFTALETNEKGETLVSRSIDENGGYLISGPEYIQAAKFQNMYRNPNKQSTTGEFGSKFVSVMFTGMPPDDDEPPKDNKVNKDKIVEKKTNVGHIGTRSFQVSNQCEWLVREKVIRANKKDFSVLEVRKSKTNYIPRILFTTTVEDYKGEKQYAPKIQKEANEGDSFPPEFFFVKLGDSSPTKISPLFVTNSFPKENRNEVQNDNCVANNLKKGLFQGLSDFSLLLYLYLNDKVPLNIMQDIAKAITTTNPSLLNPHQDFFRKFTNTSNPTPQKPTNNTSSTQLNSTQKSALESLVSMGFDEKKSLEALKATNFNIENALNFLY